MNTIIVPTDFSPSADHALRYAAELAQRWGTSLHLVHVYQIPVSVSDVPVLMVSVEELRSGAEKGLERLKASLQQHYPNLEIHSVSRLGDVTEEVKEMSEQLKPSFIVVGKHGTSGVERLLFGSTAKSMVRHLHYPVLTVPHTTGTADIRNIVLASDGNTPAKAASVIRELVQSTGARLHIVHVQQGGNDTVEHQHSLKELNPLYETIHDDDFTDGIRHYTETHQADLLIMLPHHHSFMERFFAKLHTPEVIEKVQVPILAIPE